MKSPGHFCVQLLKVALLLAILCVTDGCRRRAKPAPAAGSDAAADVATGSATQGGASTSTTDLPAKPITNGIAPPARVDSKTGKLILQGDAPVVRQKTASE
jgi:hypothetical protein